MSDGYDDFEFPPPTAFGGEVLALDFDGVAHSADVRLRRDGAPYIHSPAGGQLFEHAELLVDALKPYPHVEIVLSTTWARAYGYAAATAVLPLELRRRCVGATWHRQMSRVRFDGLSRGSQVIDYVGRRRPATWLALDDDITGWGPLRSTHLVATHPVLGISEHAVLERLREALKRFSTS